MYTPTNPLSLPQTPTLAHYTKYSYTDITECAALLSQLYKLDFETETKRFGAVWNKYSLPRYMFVLKKQPINTLPLH